MASLKGYTPPKIGDVCLIRKSFGEWSPNTQVVIIGLEIAEEPEVYHAPTKRAFSIPVELLVRKRDRSK
jgi:hypothetical protein